MANCKYCGAPVSGGVVLDSECYEALTKENEALKAALKRVDVKCYECANRYPPCDAVAYICDDCTRLECPCRHCENNSNWEWRGARK